MSKRANYPMSGGTETAKRLHSTEPQDWASDEDPLVELARIVGETTNNYRGEVPQAQTPQEPVELDHVVPEDEMAKPFVPDLSELLPNPYDDVENQQTGIANVADTPSRRVSLPQSVGNGADLATAISDTLSSETMKEPVSQPHSELVPEWDVQSHQVELTRSESRRALPKEPDYVSDLPPVPALVKHENSEELPSELQRTEDFGSLELELGQNLAAALEEQPPAIKSSLEEQEKKSERNTDFSGFQPQVTSTTERESVPPSAAMQASFPNDTGREAMIRPSLETQKPQSISEFIPDFGALAEVMPENKHIASESTYKTPVSDVRVPQAPVSSHTRNFEEDIERELLAEIEASHFSPSSSNEGRASASQQKTFAEELAELEKRMRPSEEVQVAVEPELRTDFISEEQLLADIGGVEGEDIPTDLRDTQHRTEPETPLIDEMSWPAAADLISMEEEQEGDNEARNDLLEQEKSYNSSSYDLDAVANAMRDGDEELGSANGTVSSDSLEQIPVVNQGSEQEQETLERTGRSGLRKALLAAASLLVVGGVAAGGYIYLDLGQEATTQGPARVIRADTSPMKEVPTIEIKSDSSQKQILTAEESAAGPEGEIMLPRDMAQVKPLPPAPAELDTAGSSGPLIISRAKKVRTVIVKPDGTIVSRNEAPAATLEESSTELASLLPSSQEGQLEGTVSAVPVIESASQVPSLALSSPTEQSAESGIVTTPSTPTSVADSRESASSVPVFIAKTPVGKPDSFFVDTSAVSSLPTGQRASVPTLIQQSNRTHVSTTRQNGSNASQGSLASGGYIVQVSSVRSEEMAENEIRALQRKHPQLMRSVDPAIIRADLGDRGIFYRVRMRFAEAYEANTFCDTLKNAGSDCFVRRD
ncbi:SPOR domain-containing protein [Flexibacterium corallicola]|uniref:SPOR domain-containing protein n=1 Tax=Flexibacterium corallicola TaxID=3037259 RepID=UPI00286FA438|nr:SPOR domain-containing protein [Pseudovibrio sp. M1P-2-3]